MSPPKENFVGGIFWVVFLGNGVRQSLEEVGHQE